MKFHFVHVLAEPVEYYQFAGVQLVHHKAPHIGVILQERGGIGKEHFLIHSPVVRQILEQLL